MNNKNKVMTENKGQISLYRAESFTPGEKRRPKASPLLSSSSRFITSGLPVEGYSGSVGYVISRSYSSKGNEQNNDINSLFKNNQFSLCLNPIASFHREGGSSEMFTPNNEFVNLFVDVLKELDKSYIYDFKFSLFLHTNDSKKELLFLMVQSPYDNYLFSDPDVSTEEKMMRVMGYEILYKEFEFRGYFMYINDSNIDLNSIKDFTHYAQLKFTRLGTTVVGVNENPLEDGFIEFHKPVLLKITRSRSGCSESIDNCNKSEGFNEEKSSFLGRLKIKEERLFNRMCSYLEWFYGNRILLMKAMISTPSFFFIIYLFDVLGILVLMFNYVVKGSSLCRSYPTKDSLHVSSTDNRAMVVRKFSTWNNVSSNVSSDEGCDSCGDAEAGGGCDEDDGRSFKITPENIVDVFNAKAMKNLSATGVMRVENEKIRDILRRVQGLMKNAEHSYNDEQRSTSLESGSIFLRSALSIIKNKEYNSWERQIALEILSIQYESYFISELLNNLEKGKSNVAPALVIRLLNKSLPHFVEVIKAFMDNSLAAHKLVRGSKQSQVLTSKVKLVVFIHILEPVTVASIVFTNFVKICGRSGGIEEMELINKVVESVQSHLKYFDISLSKNIPDSIQDMWNRQRDEILILTGIEKVEIGQALVDMCLNACEELFKKESVMVSSDERVNYIRIQNNFLLDLSELAFNPIRLPMVHKPNEWSLNPKHPVGGYLHPVYNEMVNSKGLVHPEIGSKIRSQICIDQINAVNFLNHQEFKINEEMLEYLLSEWKKDNSIIFSVYNKPSTESKFSSAVQEHNSLYWMYRNIMNIAILFRGETLYLPVFMDFRGRIYPLVSYLSYQGGDVARSLLNFHRPSNKLSEGEPSNNQHILIYLCNVFGKNKLSMANRVKWALTNLPIMANLYEKDRARFEVEYLEKAKEKAQFMSCFLGVYKSFISKNSSVCVVNYSNNNTPVLFDATCSGMQHLSALTTNVDLAVLVNLTQNKLNDFYAHCAEIVKKVISELPDENLRRVLSKIKIDRKLVKLPVMTIPYNIGLEGLTKKISAKFETVFEDNGEGGKRLLFRVPAELTVDAQPLVLTGSECGKLGSLIYHTVKGLMPPIKPLKQYFNGMMNVLAKLNKPIFWITPSGMKIWGSVKETRAKRIKTPILKNSKPITVRIPTDKYSYEKIRRGFIANFIHSLDAANIHYLVKIILSSPEHKNKKINLYTIHDCFASVNDQMDIVEQLVRKAFANLYFEQNYLHELDTCLMGQIKTYCNDVLISETGERTVVLTDTKTGKDEVLNIPSLPDFKWEENKEFLKEQIVNAEYFIC